MKTFIFINQKGGVGKTLSAQAVGACLYHQGHKVLLIDLDPSGHLSTCCGVNPRPGEPTVYEVLTGTATAADAIRKAGGGYDIIATDARQTGADVSLAQVKGRDYILKQALDKIKRRYDFCIIDSPPTLSIFSLMGLTAADGAIVPLNSQYLALDAVAQLLDTVGHVKRATNARLKLTGVLLTFYKARENSSQTIAAQVAEALPGMLFDARIGEYAAMKEAPARHCDLYQFRPRSKAARALEQYEALTREIIAR